MRAGAGAVSIAGMTTTTDTLAARHAGALACFNAGDLDGYVDLYADDVVFGGVTPEPLDKAGVRAFHEDFLAAFPGARAEVLETVEAGDRLAMRLLLRLHHAGPFMGLPPTGRDAALAITTIFRFACGRCVERWSTADMLGLLIQLGAVPARPRGGVGDAPPAVTSCIRPAGWRTRRPSRRSRRAVPDA